MTDKRRNAAIRKRKTLDRKCDVCSKKYDSGGYRFNKVCDDCYETAPWEGNYCCYACKGKPRAYDCKNSRCECGQHADMTTFIMSGEK